MLDLSLQLQVKKPVSSYEDMLESQLEFNDAYQSFIDYKNLCEIVVKAKASTEGIAFANELLNVSVEKIKVSVDKLNDKLKAAWYKFKELWNKFVLWFNDKMENVSVRIKAEKLKFHIEVSPNIDTLKEIVHLTTSSKWPDECRVAAGLANKHEVDINSSTHLFYPPNVVEWFKYAKAAVKGISEVIKSVNQLGEKTKNAANIPGNVFSGYDGTGKKYGFRNELGYKNSYDKTGKFHNSRNIHVPRLTTACRYILMFGPKFISKIQTSINELLK